MEFTFASQVINIALWFYFHFSWTAYILVFFLASWDSRKLPLNWLHSNNHNWVLESTLISTKRSWITTSKCIQILFEKSHWFPHSNLHAGMRNILICQQKSHSNWIHLEFLVQCFSNVRLTKLSTFFCLFSWSVDRVPRKTLLLQKNLCKVFFCTPMETLSTRYFTKNELTAWNVKKQCHMQKTMTRDSETMEYVIDSLGETINNTTCLWNEKPRFSCIVFIRSFENKNSATFIIILILHSSSFFLLQYSL